MRSSLLPVGLLVSLAACGSNSTGGGGNGTGPTYTEDVRPILEKACTSCHQAGKIAPFGLTSFDQAKNTVDAMIDATTSGRMPPWGAIETSECQPVAPFKDDPRLTDEELATLQAWKDAGTPEGPDVPDPGNANLSQFELDHVDLELANKPYVTSGDTDQLICFQLDPGLVADTFLDGWNIVPGNSKVVHHALVFLDADSESDALVDADGKYPCFGGPQLDNVNLVGAWAPGTPAFTIDDPMIGVKIPAGAKLVVQIHYHPAGTVADPDSTKFQMRYSQGDPAYQIQMILLGNFSGPEAEGGLLAGPNDTNGPEFRIPANVANHTETMEYKIPDSIPQVALYGAGTHMHYVGTDMKFSVQRPGGQEECLVQTPKWDFNWQRAYMYDRPLDQLPTAGGGDTLRMRCTYDNTMQNPFVSKALEDEGLTTPVDVLLGEQTLDEMCLAVFPIVVSSLIQ